MITNAMMRKIRFQESVKRLAQLKSDDFVNAIDHLIAIYSGNCH